VATESFQEEGGTTFSLSSAAFSPNAPVATLPSVDVAAAPKMYLESATSVTVSWTPPSMSACELERYELQLNDASGATISSVTIAEGKSTHTFDGREAGTKLTARVKAEARHPTGFVVEAADWSPLAPPLTVPAIGAIKPATLSAKTASSFEVSWNRPEETACKVVKYEVLLCDKNGKSLGISGTTKELKHSFADVEVGGEFSARVRAEAEASGGSDGSRTVTLLSSNWSDSSKTITLNNPEWSVFLGYWEKVRARASH
jgi:hypothetical protein